MRTTEHIVPAHFHSTGSGFWRGAWIAHAYCFGRIDRSLWGRGTSVPAGACVPADERPRVAGKALASRMDRLLPAYLGVHPLSGRAFTNNTLSKRPPLVRHGCRDHGIKPCGF